MWVCVSRATCGISLQHLKARWVCMVEFDMFFSCLQVEIKSIKL